MGAIEDNIASITGETATAGFVIDAQKFVVASMPKNLLRFAIKASSPSTDGSAIALAINDSIIEVQRNGYSCTEIPFSESIWAATGSGSLKEATNKHPVYWSQSDGIKIAPNTTNSQGAGYIFYIDYSKIDDDCDLRNAVIYRACSSEFTKKSRLKLLDWVDVSLPVPPSSPDFGNDLTITTITPVEPTLTASTVDTSSWGNAPTYTKPVLSFTSFPTLSWSLPPKPVAPSLTVTTIDALTDQPTFTPPAMNAPDFSDANSHMTDEDPELLQGRLGVINAQVSEYGAKMGEAQAQFNKENAIYQSVVAKITQEAQLREGNEARKLQKYQAEQASYQSEVNRVVSNNQGQIGEWQQENALSLQKYNSDIQSELNIFNKENVEYQANIQKSIQDAQLESGEEGQKLQKYATNMQVYQQEVTKEVQNYQVSLTKNTQEYQSNIALFNANLQKLQNEIGEKTQKMTSATQQSAYYGQLAEKYYNWSVMEVTSYIKNNEKSIALAQQMPAQQQRR